MVCNSFKTFLTFDHFLYSLFQGFSLILQKPNLKTCSGYYLSGPNNAKCAADKTWTFGDRLGPGGATTSHRPVCRKIFCPVPATVANGYHEARNHSYGDSVTYLCNSGYDLRSLSESFRCTALKGDVKVRYWQMWFYLLK